MMEINRRSILKSIGATTATLTFAGYATANDQARYIVRGNKAKRVTNGTGFELLAELANGKVALITGPADAEETLAKEPGIQDAIRDIELTLEEPVEVTPADDHADVSYPHEFQWDKDVQEVAEAHTITTGNSARLAIIDTGIDDTHPDLGNVNTDLSQTVLEGELTEHTGDSGYHGTHVAGITAGTGDEQIVGMAPDAELVSLRVFPEEGLAAFGDILLAAEYAAEIGCDAANMSIGTPPIPPAANAEQYRGMMQPVFQAGTREGTLYVGSAGNSDANLQQGGRFTLPNSLQGVMSVGATAPNDLRTFYSNYGTNEIDVAAPGGGYETLIKTLCVDGEYCTEPEEGEEECVECETPELEYPLNLVYSAMPGGYTWAAGTSMAAPQVTGLAGLVRDLDDGLNVKQVENAIKKGAEGSRGQSSPDFGAGRTNALNTVENVQ